MNNKTKFYYMTISVSEDCPLLVTINGFPLIHGNISRSFAYPAILNDFMVAGDNDIKITRSLDVSTDMEDSPQDGDVEIRAEINIFEDGEVVTPEDGILVPIEQIEPKSERGPENSIKIRRALAKTDSQLDPLQNIFRFNSNDLDFSSLLTGEPIEVDDSVLINYGKKLLELFNNQKLDDFLNEYGPKVSDAAAASGKNLDQYSRVVREEAEHIMKLGLAHEPDVEHGDIMVRPWCNGRIYELYAAPGNPLIVTNEDEEGSYLLPIFVSMINHTLKIVR